MGYLDLKQEQGISPSERGSDTTRPAAIHRVISNNIAHTKRGEMTGVHAIVNREEAVHRTYAPEQYRTRMRALLTGQRDVRTHEAHRWA